MISIILKITYFIFLIQSFHQHLCGEQHVFPFTCFSTAMLQQHSPVNRGIYNIIRQSPSKAYTCLRTSQSHYTNRRKYTQNYQNPAQYPFFICSTGKEGINCEANINTDVIGQNSQERTGPHFFTQVDKVSAFKVLWQLFLQLLNKQCLNSSIFKRT